MPFDTRSCPLFVNFLAKKLHVARCERRGVSCEMGKISKDIGNIGEDMASGYLKDLGYVVLERNFRSNHGEIDIVADDGPVLAFVEVKNYSFRSRGLPLQAISKRKRDGIIYTARVYLHRFSVRDRTCRFDVLAIHSNDAGERKIELVKDAFRMD